MLDDTRLREMAAALVAVRGVVGVTLGGSRARGTEAPDSDVDLGLYYRPPLDVVALRRLARDITGDDVHVTEPGEWGPWVDGGAWLRVDGLPVDWLYRDVDRVHACLEAARAGRVRFHSQWDTRWGSPTWRIPGPRARTQAEQASDRLSDRWPDRWP